MNDDIKIIQAASLWYPRIAREWSQEVADHLVFEEGFTLLAQRNEQVLGLIAVYWQLLPAPPNTYEGFINIIEVRPEARRKGIATRLVEHAEAELMRHGAHQIRAWSSEDKLEAIGLWRKMGFGLCPTTIYPNGNKVRGFFVARPLVLPAGALEQEPS